MLKRLKLLVPALIPSWRFFDTIAASPRIEVARLAGAEDAAGNWREFRPRPPSLSLGTILRRLVWNPRWNETLFLTSCAERLLENPTAHSVTEIGNRIAATLKADAVPFFRFRLVLVSREGKTLHREIVYVSPLQPVAPV